MNEGKCSSRYADRLSTPSQTVLQPEIPGMEIKAINGSRDSSQGSTALEYPKVRANVQMTSSSFAATLCPQYLFHPELSSREQLAIKDMELPATISRFSSYPLAIFQRWGATSNLTAKSDHLVYDEKRRE